MARTARMVRNRRVKAACLVAVTVAATVLVVSSTQGTSHADQAWKQPGGTTIRHEADAGESLQEGGGTGGYAKITRQSQRHAGTGRARV